MEPRVHAQVILLPRVQTSAIPRLVGAVPPLKVIPSSHCRAAECLSRLADMPDKTFERRSPF